MNQEQRGLIEDVENLADVSAQLAMAPFRIFLACVQSAIMMGGLVMTPPPFFSPHMLARDRCS